METIAHFDLKEKQKVNSSYPNKLLSEEDTIIGITAGASCPSNLIEETILRVFEMRGISNEEVHAA